MQASILRKLKGKRLQLALKLTLLYFIFGMTLAAFVPRKANKHAQVRIKWGSFVDGRNSQ